MGGNKWHFLLSNVRGMPWARACWVVVLRDEEKQLIAQKSD